MHQTSTLNKGIKHPHKTKASIIHIQKEDVSYAQISIVILSLR